MEQENIQYTGITQATSDLNCPDGDLSVSHNIINHNGAMRPIILPEAEFALNSGETLLYVHSTSGRKNFIFRSGNNIQAFTFQNNSRKDYSISYSLSSGEELNKIESVGNTLILLTTKEMFYWLFSELDYKYLGSEIPEIALDFGLTTTPLLYSDTESPHNQKYWAFTFIFDDILKPQMFNEFSESNKSQITNQVMAVVNKFINDNSIEKGQFLFPFFVRYALRLYDGTLTHHSTPILMIPSTKSGPMILCDPYGTDSSIRSAKADIFSAPCKLNYALTIGSVQAKKKLKNWEEIVKSIDVFISEPIYTFDPNGEFNFFIDRKAFSNSLVGKLMRTSTSTKASEFYDYYQKWDFRDLLSIYTNTYLDKDLPRLALPLPVIDSDDFNKRIEDCSTFYYIASLRIDQLSTNRTGLDISPGTLKNLVLKERMTDDYQSHDKLIPNYSFVYNNRLNIANSKRELFNGFSTYALSCRNEWMVKVAISNDGIIPIVDAHIYLFPYYVFIKENGKDIIVAQSACEGFHQELPEYFFYPNPHAYKVIFQYNSSDTLIELNLKTHTSLNGAYFFSNFKEIEKKYTSEPKESVDRTVSIPNKLYTSEVGNPFFFPLEGINTIGVGKILGMASTTRALSQGQFGQFPLLVFATDGIWAMEVSPNGLYSVKQPISRDICSNPKSITQIDGAVIFISDKGAMIIDADQVNTFSAELDGLAFSPASVIQFDVIAKKEGLTKELSSLVPAKDFFMNCQIAYDYPNSRLLFINADKPYAYVYSLQSHSWATVTSSFTHVVTDYPHTYLQDNNQQIVNISSKIDYESDSRVKSVLLSRPIKLGDDMLKTVNQIINRGNFETDKINVVLFASTDGITYFPIGSAIGPRISGLCGSPYRYFRIAVISNFSAKDSLSATSVYYTPKWRNKPR